MKKIEKKFFCFELFEKALLNKGLNERTFALQIGVSPATVNNWKHVKNIKKIQFREAIERILDVKYEDLCLNESGEPIPMYGIEQHDHKKEWPLIGNSRGGEFLDVIENSEYTDYAESWEALPEGCKSIDANGFAIKLVGDSMEPKLPSGSILFISPNTQAQNGDIALVIIEGRLGRESCVKVIYNEENQIKLHSFNSQYADKFINKKYVIAIYKVIGYRVTAEGIF